MTQSLKLKTHKHTFLARLWESKATWTREDYGVDKMGAVTVCCNTVGWSRKSMGRTVILTRVQIPALPLKLEQTTWRSAPPFLRLWCKGLCGQFRGSVRGSSAWRRRAPAALPASTFPQEHSSLGPQQVRSMALLPSAVGFQSPRPGGWTEQSLCRPVASLARTPPQSQGCETKSRTGEKTPDLLVCVLASQAHSFPKQSMG